MPSPTTLTGDADDTRAAGSEANSVDELDDAPPATARTPASIVNRPSLEFGNRGATNTVAGARSPRVDNVGLAPVADAADANDVSCSGAAPANRPNQRSLHATWANARGALSPMLVKALVLWRTVLPSRPPDIATPGIATPGILVACIADEKLDANRAFATAATDAASPPNPAGITSCGPCTGANPPRDVSAATNSANRSCSTSCESFATSTVRSGAAS